MKNSLSSDISGGDEINTRIIFVCSDSGMAGNIVARLAAAAFQSSDKENILCLLPLTNMATTTKINFT